MFNSIILKLSDNKPIRNGILHGLFLTGIFSFIYIIVMLSSKNANAELFDNDNFRTVDHPIVTWYTPETFTTLDCLFVADTDGNGMLGSYRMMLTPNLKMASLVPDTCQYFKGTFSKQSGYLIVFNVNNVGSALLVLDENKNFLLEKYNIW